MAADSPRTTEPDDKEPAKRPPGPVIVVALFQFFKAGFLLFLTFRFIDVRALVESPNKSSFGKLILCALAALVAAGMGYFIRSGVGLIRLEKFARRRVMWNIVAGWLLFGTSLNGIFFGEGPFIHSWSLRTLACVLLLDSFLYCCLALYPDVARAFGDKNGIDLLP